MANCIAIRIAIHIATASRSGIPPIDKNLPPADLRRSFLFRKYGYVRPHAIQALLLVIKTTRTREKEVVLMQETKGTKAVYLDQERTAEERAKDLASRLIL
jgi:hypothetical protein